MSLLTKLLFFPIAGPVAGIRWSLGKVQRVVEEELVDDTSIKQDLMELQLLLELGDIDDAEYVEREAVLMKRLREVRHWREQFGLQAGPGPVRVARDAREGGEEAAAAPEDDAGEDGVRGALE
ncbi:MAG TPA: gas vesicle protein GvpG [Gemmatimonadaceae bacterium]|jgi:Gas vesicle protein G.